MKPRHPAYIAKVLGVNNPFGSNTGSTSYSHQTPTNTSGGGGGFYDDVSSDDLSDMPF
jgi:hypothetical protein